MEANNLSYWEAKSLLPQADIFILGGGMVGLSTAISLKEKNPKLQICMLDKFVYPQGASTKNAGFACFGSVSEILDDLSKAPEEEVLSLIQSRWEGLQILRQRLGDRAIGYEAVGGFEVFRSDEHNFFHDCVEKIDYLNEMVDEVIQCKNCFSIYDKVESIPDLKAVGGVISNRLEGLLDTGKMLMALIQKAKEHSIHLLYGMPIERIIYEGNEGKIFLKSNMGWIIPVPKLVVATNGFTQQLLPEVKVDAVRNQVLVTSPIPGLSLKGGFHMNEGYVYFRNIGNRILIGGGRHIDLVGETTDEFGVTSVIQEYLKEVLNELFAFNTPYQYDFCWSGILGVGSSKTPLVKRLNQNLVIGVRLGGMGVALSSKIGMDIAELILES